MALVGVTGFVVFKHATVDPLQRADVIVVLGGEHDGREDYGISLARAGWAPTVLLSNPYDADDPIMRRVCHESGGGIETMCLRPNPLTTRGEAEMTHRLAKERSWNRIIVVSWRYHLPRARMIFGKCFPDPGALVMREVPRPYDMSILSWEFVYFYQYAGLVKTVFQAACP
ncbi:MAG: YdcF family protein [Mycolicibacterium sp.]|nr:YdcF family protein [Mycolicibacterium sp.]